ncbi:response regulator transcription factor [Mucilaginibacter sp. KACC 22063]|uniref:response regulator transcription factor n=1 Tax=Mucilaginibacter sp. KACC 22063 TaxID=3025666 RepID=UPI002365ED04|nr:response regulator transcription factor [Mucilaginibacter sp. KACC 22063]WDF57230.1 response regulator transcription factor [Mucilaginibacter sp. KACC 22063]
MMSTQILLIEDEPVLASIIKESLESREFEVATAANGVEGWSLFNELKPALCIVDVMLPKKDGYTLVRDIRMVDKRIPLIFLTARTQTEDVLKGLELGADDYMKKPFSMEELILRIKALLRRNENQDLSVSQPAIFKLGQLQFNFLRLEIIDKEETNYLSQREADLLLLLIQNKNRLLDRRTALLKLWGEDNRFNARSMDVYITRLRKFLKDEPSLVIQSVRGQGYKLAEI